MTWDDPEPAGSIIDRGLKGLDAAARRRVRVSPGSQNNSRQVKKIAVTKPCRSANAAAHPATEPGGMRIARAMKTGNRVDVIRPSDSAPPANIGGTRLTMTKRP